MGLSGGRTPLGNPDNIDNIKLGFSIGYGPGISVSEEYSYSADGKEKVVTTISGAFVAKGSITITTVDGVTTYGGSFGLGIIAGAKLDFPGAPIGAIYEGGLVAEYNDGQSFLGVRGSGEIANGITETNVEVHLGLASGFTLNSVQTSEQLRALAEIHKQDVSDNSGIALDAVEFRQKSETIDRQYDPRGIGQWASAVTVSEPYDDALLGLTDIQIVSGTLPAPSLPQPAPGVPSYLAWSGHNIPMHLDMGTLAPQLTIPVSYAPTSSIRPMARPSRLDSIEIAQKIHDLRYATDPTYRDEYDNLSPSRQYDARIGREYTSSGEPIAKSNHRNTDGTHGGIDPDGNSGGGGGPSSGGGNSGRSGHNSGTGLSGEDRPIILDLDGDGVQITELSNSTVFVDSSGDGLQNLTAWAAAGNGVLFYDADGDGVISETREYVFTEWDPTATSDIEALRSVFDTNGDGVFDANDDAWSDFKVLVTQPDGSLVAMTLDELGITSIDLTADATNIELPDGSVITGTTTFTWSDGSTGTVADTMLVSETASYRIEETETIADTGIRTHVQTGYAADGTIAFAITSVTTADGTSITNSYDNNGDGVVDRMQTIDTVTNPDGSKSETVTNKAGSDFTTGILVSETKTTTSADGNTVTIERDSTGGGWYDQVEVRTTHADDSMTIVTTDIGPDGSVNRSSTETVSADGLTRTDAIDEDGDGVVDLTITHSIVINADGSRSETIEYFNEDGSLRSSVTESVSADGRTKTIARDVDGDGAIDTQEELSIAVNADGSTHSTQTVKNGDGSLRSTSTHTQSDDALIKSSAVDQDGDGDVDLTTVEATVINVDDSRETTTTQTNADGSVRSQVKVTLGSDQVSSETWIDHNQDGTFQATDLSRSVTVDGTTGERTTTSWTRNADGTYSAKSVSVSSEDGLVVNTSVDADGDGDTDLSISDVTVENADGTSTRTITETAQDGSPISEQVITTSADGLTVTTVSDIDGDGAADGKSVSTQLSNADGSTLSTVTSYAGDQTTLLGQTTVSQSADRRDTVTSSDSNGDGAVDTVVHSVKHADGSRTALETNLNADGSTRSTQQSDVSADGLTVTVASDLDGDGDTDATSTQTTVLNADGGRTTTGIMRNGDNSLRSQSVTTVSDDGLVTTTTADTDGDGTFERETVSTTELLGDGSKKITVDTKSSDGSLLTRTETSVSDDGLITETRADSDGDLSADIVTTSVTVLNDDGSTTVTTTVTDVTGPVDELRTQVVTTTSDNGRDVLETTDQDGDGVVDSSVHQVIGDDGVVTVTETAPNNDGSTQSQMVSVTSADGLVTSTRYDADGNGVFERDMTATATLNADGSTTRVITERAEDGSVYSSSVVETSADGQTTTTREDWDNDGDDDLTRVHTIDLSASGVETTTVTQTAADGSTLSTSTTVTSADGRTVRQMVDADGNGVDDAVMTTTRADDGTRTRVDQYFDDAGTLIAANSATVSDDGLITTTRTDRDGDGTDELVVTSATVLATDGSQNTTHSYADGSGTLLAQTTATASDDGLSTSWSADYDGDGTNEFVTTGTTVLEGDGDVVQSTTTLDGTGATIGTVTTTTSGNGLSSSTAIDIDGDGTTDRTSDLLTQANGAWTQSDQQFGPGSALVQDVTVTQSADGRTYTRQVDEDGDGTADRDLRVQEDLDRNTTSTWRDLSSSSTATSIITGVESANGFETDYTFDLNGDGQAEITHEADIRFDAAGARITEIKETHGQRTSFRETVVSSFDGLTQTVRTDVDGDGDIDVTQISTTTLHEDGTQTRVVDATYADGSTKSALTETISTDGRTTTVVRDYDGDGIDDVEVTSITASDGSFRQVEDAFDAQGDLQNTRTTTVSADGLLTTIVTDETSLTIDLSPVGNGSYTTSYTSDDLSYTSAHVVDGAGVETWTLTQTENGTTSSFEVRLSADMKGRLIAEAERLYDTLFDRDMDRSEIETLIAHVENGELNIANFADELMLSDEFTMRYSSMTDASFIQQIYTNAYGRGASLNEFATALSSLTNGSVSRSDFAAQVSESSEHIVVGNGHMSSNNFDVFLNPAKAERNTDNAYVSAVAVGLVAVLYNKELAGFSHKLLVARAHDGEVSLAGLASQLAAGTSEVVPDYTIDLPAMSNTDFVTHVLQNAFGVTPSASDVAYWTGMLASDDMTRGEFALMIAQSVDYKASGSFSYLASANVDIGANDDVNVIIGQQAIDSVTGDARNNILDGSGVTHGLELSGGHGDDTLRGGNGSDFLYGGAGADHIYGNDGHDYLFIDAADLVSGTVNGGWGFDTVKVLDSIGVSFVMVGHSVEAVYGGSGNDVLQGTGHTYGIFISGGDGDDVVLGGNGNDNLFGDGGADHLDGGIGDDYMVGGNGHDHLNGNAGSDRLYGGDGQDRLLGGEGDDYLLGGLGDDKLFGENGNDVIRGGKGDDVLIAVSGQDLLIADEGSDKLFGGDGKDSLFGGAEDDFLQGNDSEDVLVGGGGDDRLFGGKGDDRLQGGKGDDFLSGGASEDVFVFNASGPTGADRIQDFEDGKDLLEFSNITFDDIDIVQVGADTVITWAGGSVTLANTSASDVTEDDFAFADLVQHDGVGLHIGADGKYLIDDNDTVVEVSNQGTQATFDHFVASGWTAKQVAAQASGIGYLIYWEHVDGSQSIWEVDAQGASTAGQFNGTAEFVGFETAFGTDFNGDGVIGHTYTERDGTGDVKLLTVDTDNDHYAVENASGEIIRVTWLGLPVSDNTQGGWTALQAAAHPDGAGYLIYWELPDGSQTIWELDAQGTTTAGHHGGTPAFTGFETVFGTDFDANGVIGHTYTVRDGAGDVKLLTVDTDSDCYAIETANGEIIRVTYQGLPVSDNTQGGWTALQAAAHPDGAGYLIYWELPDGSQTIWELDAQGTTTVGHQGGTPEFIGFETAFGTDFDASGVIGHSYTVRDGSGDVKLLTVDTDSDYYAVETASGEIIRVTWQGLPVSDNTHGGWTALQVAANPDRAGYLIYWEHPDGSQTIWEVDENGTSLGGTGIGTAAFTGYETAFGADFNGDGVIGHSYTERDVTGDIKLLTVDTDSDYYAIEAASGEIIRVTWLGLPVSDNTQGGWTALQAAAHPDGAGYLIYWELPGGSQTIWELDAQGTTTVGHQGGTPEFIGFETAFGADFNGDGVIGHIYTERDGAGDVKLLTVDTDSNFYAIEVANGETIRVTSQNGPVNDSTLTGWTALQAEAHPDGAGYLIYWEHADGLQVIWEVDEQGAYLIGHNSSTSAFVGFETAFGTDFDGDGTVGHVYTERDETSGVKLLTVDTADDRLAIESASGDIIDVTHLDNFIFESNYAGHTAEHIAEDPIGDGYLIYWTNANGTDVIWDVGADGQYLFGYQVDASILTSVETAFGVDFNDDGVLGYV
ncbi:DUF4214 domain-containing protein [uncultured Ruegeria sp.]|uniref:DUF4214 domain-containing protein n=1 Tax=uncultured Ruegeria sp. TaxID=259304 RepID=UPI00262E528B|nr:DUF4214 domain-containing protein [uncultured Ruegeria sp.]